MPLFEVPAWIVVESENKSDAEYLVNLLLEEKQNSSDLIEDYCTGNAGKVKRCK